MVSNGLFIIGTNLMVLAHVHSFVLLTANFDDVKKLAQKFVSESIAETIADFVARASGNKIATKASKEMNVSKSRDQLESDSVSEEDKEKNITKESISKENMKYKSKTLNSKTQKAKFQSKFMNAFEQKSIKKKEKIKDMKENKNIHKGYISKSNNLNDFSEDSANNNVSVESTAGYQDERVPDRDDKDATSDQDEEQASDYAFRLKNESKERQFKIDRTFILTTRREKIEFDQYDNINYPKAVATSGSVTLKRLLDSRKSRYRDQNLSEKNESS